MHTKALIGNLFIAHHGSLENAPQTIFRYSGNISKIVREGVSLVRKAHSFAHENHILARENNNAACDGRCLARENHIAARGDHIFASENHSPVCGDHGHTNNDSCNTNHHLTVSNDVKATPPSHEKTSIEIHFITTE